MSDYEDGLRRLDPTEFRKQYEGTWEPPAPLTDVELNRMERRHYKGNQDAYRLTIEVRRQRTEIVRLEQQRDVALALAERRAGEIADLEAAVRDLWRKVPDYKARDLDAATIGLVNKATSPFAAASPPASE